MKLYMTDCNGKMKQSDKKGVLNPEYEINLVKLYPQIKYQEIIGFGGAFTEASAYVWSGLSKEAKEAVIEDYFGETGNQYTFGRTHIQSCDFSLGNRAYVEEGDDSLAGFSIEGDYKYQIPFIKAALEKNPSIQFLASPWSPPAFMKDNNAMNGGGHLLKKYYKKWAEMIVRYLLAYREEGIKINRITVQNEPDAKQSWESCIYTGEEEGIFAVRYLRTALDQAGLSDVSILIWDHNKDMIVERTEETFSVPGADKAIDGIAFHWYSGDHFESLEYVRQTYPDKELVFSEGCVEYSRFGDDQQANAEMYVHDMIGNFKAGTNGFLDWNLLLDGQGGPNHRENYCDSPLICDGEHDQVRKNLSYYYIGHFSRFICPGARRILVSNANSGLETVAFENPNGSKIVVVMNAGEKEQNFNLRCENRSWAIILLPHSIMTACLDE